MIFTSWNEPNAVAIESNQGWHSLKCDRKNEWSCCSGLKLTARSQGEDKFMLSLASSKQPVKTVKVRWNLLMTGKLAIMGDHWERAYGDLEWRGIVPERIMPWYFLANDGNVTSGFGVETGAHAFCYWQLDNEGITFTADVRNGNSGVELHDRILPIATLVYQPGQTNESSFAAARRFCQAMCPKPSLPSQPVYGGNNWYYAYGNSSHNEILEDSRFISSLASSQNNRPFMVIDDGWQLSSGGGACNGGPWTGNHHFPDMERLAKEMKEVGVKPGIWCRPLLTSEQVAPDWIRYCVGNGNVLDPSIPEVLSEVAKSIKQFSAWGYELIKHDFSTFDILGKWGFQMKSDPNGIEQPFADQSLTTAEIILNFYRTIAEASGNSLIIGCNTVSHLAAGLFEIQRTGDDTSGKSWERTRYMGVNTLAFRMPQHGTFYSHDADCVGITPEVPWELNSRWLELLAGSGTPLFISADAKVVTEEQKEAIRRAFDLAAEPLVAGIPLDWMDTTCPKRWMLNGQEIVFGWNNLETNLNNEPDNHWWL